jgi:hypothetical protein
MSKRFGRNQKRKMREQYAELEKDYNDVNELSWNLSRKLQRAQHELHYLHERPVLMRQNRPINPNLVSTFCIDVSHEQLHYTRLDSRQLFNWIANELADAVRSDERLRGLIVSYEPPTCDISKIMEM